MSVDLTQRWVDEHEYFYLGMNIQNQVGRVGIQQDAAILRVNYTLGFEDQAVIGGQLEGFTLKSIDVDDFGYIYWGADLNTNTGDVCFGKFGKTDIRWVHRFNTYSAFCSNGDDTLTTVSVSDKGGMMYITVDTLRSDICHYGAEYATVLLYDGVTGIRVRVLQFNSRSDTSRGTWDRNNYYFASRVLSNNWKFFDGGYFNVPGAWFENKAWETGVIRYSPDVYDYGQTDQGDCLAFFFYTVDDFDFEAFDVYVNSAIHYNQTAYVRAVWDDLTYICGIGFCNGYFGGFPWDYGGRY